MLAVTVHLTLVGKLAQFVKSDPDSRQVSNSLKEDVDRLDSTR